MYRKCNISAIARQFPFEIQGSDLTIDGVGLCNRQTRLTSILSYAESENYIKAIKNNKAIKCLILSHRLYQEYKSELPDLTYIITENAEESFYRLYEYLVYETDFFTTDRETKIGNNCSIHKSALIEKGVTIGNGVKIGPNCCILTGSILNDRVTVCAGTVIGETGFQVIHYEDGLHSVPHVGGVYIENDVFIGANTIIARSLFEGYTKIGSHTQIGDHVVISHNCVVEENVTLVSGSVLTGSVYIECGAFIGAGSRISNRIRVSRNAFVGLGSVVTKNVKAGVSLYPDPAKTYEELLMQRRKEIGN